MTQLRAEYPHCNTEVLHAPGTCDYCDMYPDRQAARAASGGGFTPAEANGWPGNVAQQRPAEFVDWGSGQSFGYQGGPSLLDRIRRWLGR